MRFMVLVKASEDSEAGVMPGSDELAEMGQYNEELVAGFSLWEVQSMDEALEWVKRSPSSANVPIDIEIRPLLELEDFGTDFPAEEVAQWEKMTGRA